MKVAVFSSKDYEVPILEKENGGKHQLVFIEKALSPDSVHLAEGCQAIAVFTNDDVCEEVLKKLAVINIKFIATRSAGHDHIDLPAAEALRIQVANVPEYSPYAIAEHTLAMILAMNRKIVRADHKVKDNDFSLGDLIGFDLHGKTVGVVGLGKIGSIVVKILHGFGCKIVGYDIQKNENLVQKYGVEYLSLEDLCRKADIISLHAPFNPHTKYMIRKETIDLMKRGVMIVNTGRGPLINTADAIEALKEGKIGYLGLDVYEKEKGLFFYDYSHDVLRDDLFARLLTFKNVLITGHQAFLTENALTNIADTTIYNLSCFEKGEISKNELTAYKYAHQV